MEKILGVIEDSLNLLESGSPDEKEDARQELMMNIDSIMPNLTGLVNGGNAEAKTLLDRLQNVKL